MVVTAREGTRVDRSVEHTKSIRDHNNVEQKYYEQAHFARLDSLLDTLGTRITRTLDAVR